MVYFEKDVEPALCHAAGRISDKKDQEKAAVHPGTFQRVLWSSECCGCYGDDVQRSFVPGGTIGPLSPQH